MKLFARSSDAAPAAKFPPVTGPADAYLMGAVVLLIAFGVVMVYSASAVFASEEFGNGYVYLVRQAVFATVALVLIVGLARVDYHRYQKLTYVGLGVSAILLVAVIVGFGRDAGGATRWIAVGPINIQPAEVAKVALIFWLAHSLSKKREQIRSFSVGFLPHIVVASIFMMLCLKQPDFGSAVMIAFLTFVLLFTAGANRGYLIGSILIAAPAAYLLVATSRYRMERIEAFLDPFAHRYDQGYQLSESLMGFGAGGVTGVGIGDSRQKLFFLPEAHTDFIGAIIGEELGFIGILALIALFVFIVWRGITTAVRAADDYGTYLATGITMFLGLQAFTNLAVAMGMVPTKGLVLPFVSYGGSALLVNAAALGVLLNVSRPRQVEETAPPVEEKAPNVKRHGRAIAQGGTA